MRFAALCICRFTNVFEPCPAGHQASVLLKQNLSFRSRTQWWPLHSLQSRVELKSRPDWTDADPCMSANIFKAGCPKLLPPTFNIEHSQRFVAFESYLTPASAKPSRNKFKLVKLSPFTAISTILTLPHSLSY